MIHNILLVCCYEINITVTSMAYTIMLSTFIHFIIFTFANMLPNMNLYKSKNIQFCSLFNGLRGHIVDVTVNHCKFMVWRLHNCRHKGQGVFGILYNLPSSVNIIDKQGGKVHRGMNLVSAWSNLLRSFSSFTGLITWPN